jgi:hypothetical protein
MADSTDVTTWSSFEEAVQACQTDKRYEGVGFVFAADDPYCGIDLDNCIDPATGELKAWGQQFIDQLDSYSEISPSGMGVKVIVQGRKPGPRCKKAFADGEVEIYDHDRFFTITGHHLAGTPNTTNSRQDAIDDLYQKVFGAALSAGPVANLPAPVDVYGLSDDEIVERASHSRNGAKFAAMWAGNWNGHFSSQSEADLSVVSTLAFYSKDAVQIDRMFRTSGLMRAKWDEKHGAKTYGQMTMDKALETVTQQYRPGGPRDPDGQDHGGPERKVLRTFTNEVVGLELRATDATKRSKGRVIEVQFDALICGGPPTPIRISSGLRGTQDAARMLGGWVAVAKGQDKLSRQDQVAIQQFVATVMGQAPAILEEASRQSQASAAADKHRPTVEQVVMQEASRIEGLSFKNADGTIWSERHARNISRGEFERMASRELLDACEQQARDLPESSKGKSRPIGFIKQYLPLAWSTALHTLPTEIASPLGPDSAAARRLEHLIVQIFQTTAQWRKCHSPTGIDIGTELTTLAGLARDRLMMCESTRCQGWIRLHNTIDAWCVSIPRPDKPPLCWLGIRYTIGVQLDRSGKLVLPNIRDQHDLSVIAGRYGLAAGAEEEFAPTHYVRDAGRPCKLLVLSRALCDRILDYAERGDGDLADDACELSPETFVAPQSNAASPPTARRRAADFFSTVQNHQNDKTL